MCTPSVAGTYAMEGRSECSECQGGFVPTENKDNCVKCRAGTFGATCGNMCAPCVAGKCAMEGRSECSECQGGFVPTENQGNLSNVGLAPLEQQAAACKTTMTILQFLNNFCTCTLNNGRFLFAQVQHFRQFMRSNLPTCSCVVGLARPTFLHKRVVFVNV